MIFHYFRLCRAKSFGNEGGDGGGAGGGLNNSVTYRQGANVEFEGPAFVTTDSGREISNMEFNLGSVSTPSVSGGEGGGGGASTASTAEMASTTTAASTADAGRDFSNPVFDAMRSMENAAALAAAHPLEGPPPMPTAAADDSDLRHEPTPFDEADIRAGFEPPPMDAAASSKASPKGVKKPKETAPSKVDTGKDTQCLVEEGDEEEEEGQDFSEC